MDWGREGEGGRIINAQRSRGIVGGGRYWGNLPVLTKFFFFHLLVWMFFFFFFFLSSKLFPF